MAQQTFSGILSLLIILTLVTACEKQQEVVEDLRALKTITVSAPATGQVRKFSGTVSATDSASLSFEVGGRVETVNVDIGDAVKKVEVIRCLTPILTSNASSASSSRTGRMPLSCPSVGCR